MFLVMLDLKFSDHIFLLCIQGHLCALSQLAFFFILCLSHLAVAC